MLSLGISGDIGIAKTTENAQRVGDLKLKVLRDAEPAKSNFFFSFGQPDRNCVHFEKILLTHVFVIV